MTESTKTLPSSPAATASRPMTVRELSTEKRSEWIERIFSKLGSIYGQAFKYNWAGNDPEEVKQTWADILGGFAAEDIGNALKACYSLPKVPSAPEFAALCRQAMNQRIKPAEKPLTKEDREASAKLADEVASKFKAGQDAKAKFHVNGVAITNWTMWAYRLMEREAGGECIPVVSMEAWREVLGFPADVKAKEAMAQRVAA